MCKKAILDSFIFIFLTFLLKHFLIFFYDNSKSFMIDAYCFSLPLY